MDWALIENEFTEYYSQKGAPSIPIRIMVGLILLKQVYRLSDKSSLAHWVENPYWQYFCGEVYFQVKPPFYYSDFSHFRKRIGIEGGRKIARLGNDIFGSAYAKSYGAGKNRQDLPVGFTGFIYRFGTYLVRLTSH
jgi:IS5 family transposase